MYNKPSSSFNRKHVYNPEDEPPEKKLVSDADLYIKQLSEKQRNTETSLEEQLSSKYEFYKATEIVPLTNYTSGSSSLDEFTSVMKYSDEIEKLKACGLGNADIELFFDYNKGKEYFFNKHKNMNEDVLENRIKYILETIHKSRENVGKCNMKGAVDDRLKTELFLSAKPASIETKLLKFALENKSKTEEKLPHPMDSLKHIERQFESDLSNINPKKIRRKARSLQRQIDSITSTQIKEPQIIHKNKAFPGNSQWDIREPQIPKPAAVAEKVFTCKPQNYYTIKNGEIIKVNLPHDDNEKYTSKKLSVEEIREIPKFADYTEGTPSKFLYLKNLANAVTEADLKNVIKEFSQETVESVKIMKGKMRGQAFVEAKSEEVADLILKRCNGIVIRNRPIIMQFRKAHNSK